MDFTWLILFALIAIVSAILSKRKEREEAAKRQRQQGCTEAEGREEERPMPTGAGPPVAPGPFGPVLKRKPPRLPEPKPAPERKAQRTATPLPSTSERREAPRSPFEEMRADLERRERDQAPVSEPRAAQPESGARSERTPVRPVLLPSEMLPKPPRPQPGVEPVRAVHRMVQDASVARPPARARRLRFDHTSVRQALVMSEILGKPVSMRFERHPWDSF